MKSPSCLKFPAVPAILKLMTIWNRRTYRTHLSRGWLASALYRWWSEGGPAADTPTALWGGSLVAVLIAVLTVLAIS